MWDERCDDERDRTSAEMHPSVWGLSGDGGRHSTSVTVLQTVNIPTEDWELNTQPWLILCGPWGPQDILPEYF